MGASFTKLFNALTSSKEEIGLLMVGLIGSGKTTILYKLKLGETIATSITVGCNIERLECKNIRFIVYDAGAQNVKLPLLRLYIRHGQVKALIYVVDCNDRDCFGDPDHILYARDDLQMILNEDELRDAPLLVMANKQDLPDAMDVEDVTDKLGLRSLPHPRLWHVQSTSAITGEGLHEGLDWLASHVLLTNKK